MLSLFALYIVKQIHDKISYKLTIIGMVFYNVYLIIMGLANHLPTTDFW